jgi:flagellar hook-length control protein FliK
LPRPTRPAQQDRAPSPFESLLDDGTQAADQSAPPTTEKATPTESSHASAKSNDPKSAAANDDVPATKPDRVDPAVKPDGDGNPSADNKPDVKVETAAAAGEGIKTADNTDKPGDGTKSENSTAASPTEGAQTVTTNSTAALAHVIAPMPDQAPAPNNIDQQAQPQELSAIVVGGMINLSRLDPAASKAGVGKQVDAGKKAEGNTQAETDPSTNEITDGVQLTTKGTPQVHPDNPQLTASDSDKERIAQARGEAPAKDRQVDADGPAPVSASDTNIAAQKIATDAAQPAMPNTSQTTTTAPANNAPATQPAPLAVAVPLAGLAVDIAGKALAGKNRFEIRLDPPELGRIEVRLDVDRDGNVTSRLTVDRADTLDLLRRDASGLERALQDAGLKTADNGLQFSLRDQSMNQQQTNSGSDTATLVLKDETQPSIDVIPQNYGRLAGQGVGLDIRV